MQTTLDWFKPSKVDILLPEFALDLYEDSFSYQWMNTGIYLDFTIWWNSNGELDEVIFAWE